MSANTHLGAREWLNVQFSKTPATPRLPPSSVLASVAPMLSPALRAIQLYEGSVMPLGAHWLPEEQAFNFSLYSQHARAVTLLFVASLPSSRNTAARA